MINFFKDKNNDTSLKGNLLLKTASLLIHAAKIDENFTEKEEDIIKQTLIVLGANESNITELIINAKNNEAESNHILEFTREVKNADNGFKIKVIEALWTIIYSNSEADIYEANLMRRLSGLLYIDSKTMGDIKEKTKKKFSK